MFANMKAFRVIGNYIFYIYCLQGKFILPEELKLPRIVVQTSSFKTINQRRIYMRSICHKITFLSLFLLFNNPAFAALDQNAPSTKLPDNKKVSQELVLFDYLPQKIGQIFDYKIEFNKEAKAFEMVTTLFETHAGAYTDSLIGWYKDLDLDHPPPDGWHVKFKIIGFGSWGILFPDLGDKFLVPHDYPTCKLEIERDDIGYYKNVKYVTWVYKISERSVFEVLIFNDGLSRSSGMYHYGSFPSQMAMRPLFVLGYSFGDRMPNPFAGDRDWVSFLGSFTMNNDPLKVFLFIVRYI